VLAVLQASDHPLMLKAHCRRTTTARRKPHNTLIDSRLVSIWHLGIKLPCRYGAPEMESSHDDGLLIMIIVITYGVLRVLPLGTIAGP
jgi:hypothetical protein